MCKEQGGEGFPNERTQVLCLAAGEEVERSVYLLAVLTLCRGGLFELLQQFPMGEQIVAQLEQGGLLIRGQAPQS